MTDLQQAIRDSALALGKEISIDEDGTVRLTNGFWVNGLAEEWNPPEDEKHDRLLLYWLLDEGYGIHIRSTLDHFISDYTKVHKSWELLHEWHCDCPPNEFLTRATAAVWAAKESEK